MTTSDRERKYHALTHASAPIIGWLGGMTFLGPLVMWLAFKDEHPSIERHGKLALNFHITMIIATIVSALLFIPIAFLAIGVGQEALSAVLIALAVVWLISLILFQFITPIVMAFKAYNGRFNKYPFAYPFFKLSKFDG